MPSGKFAQSSGRHLFPILLLDFLRRNDLVIGISPLILAAKPRFDGYHLDLLIANTIFDRLSFYRVLVTDDF